jgi:hypothetical protein
MIFRGYTVVFRIKEYAIHVFGLIHMQLSPTD